MDEETLKEVYDVEFYNNVNYQNGINQVKLENTNSVCNLVSGYVVKIIKNGLLYTVNINGLDYQFIGLTNIEVNLYEYVDAGEILGLANFDEIYEIYFFDLIIKDKEEVYSYFEKAD